MRKFLFALVGVFAGAVAFAAGDNIPTSKNYVDNTLALKQDKIAASDTTMVLTNTGTAGEYGTQGIYDAAGEYAPQAQNLVDAITMNTAVQNAIDSEFQCIEWDENNECLLFNLGGIIQVPAGYTQLEYLESTGTQWIDTGIKGNLNTKAILDFQIRNYNANGYILGSRTDQNTNAFLIGSYNGRFVNSTYPFSQFDGVPEKIVAQLPNFDLNRHIFELSSNGFYIDGTLYETFSNPTPFTTRENITLFARYSYDGFKRGNFISYGLKLYESDTLVRNFIPARRNLDGVLGMYDTVTNTFFTNAGTGKFIGGPVANIYLPTGE